MLTHLVPTPQQILLPRNLPLKVNTILIPQDQHENKYSNPENNSKGGNYTGKQLKRLWIIRDVLIKYLSLPKLLFYNAFASSSGNSLKSYTKNKLEILGNVRELVKRVY